jgi:hypothetical protein
VLFRLGDIVAITRQCLWMVCRQAVCSLSAKNNKGAEGVLLMPTAIELIVGTYVLLKNRRALEEMLLHRQRLAIDLNCRSGFDVSQPIDHVNEDIAVIEAGLVLLGGSAAVPLVDWS